MLQRNREVKRGLSRPAVVGERRHFNRHPRQLDSLAYVDQLGGTVYNTGYDADKYDTWQPLDVDAGY